MDKKNFELLSDSSFMVMAGAGAGKTTRLVNHIVENFLAHKKTYGKWPRIVGTTFTKKAASEIQDRVSVLYQSFNDPEIFDFAYSNHLNVGTIHSLCLQLLRSKFNHLGFTQDLKVVNSESLQFQQKRILYDVIRTNHKAILSVYGFNSLAGIVAFIGKRKEIELKPVTVECQNKILLELITDSYSKLNVNLEKITLENLAGIKKADLAFEYLKSLKKSLLDSVNANDYLPVFNFFQEYPFTKPRFKLKDFEAQNIWETIWQFRNSLKSDLEKNYLKVYDRSSFETLSNYSSDILNIEKSFRKKLLDYKKKSSLIELADIEPLTLELLKNHRDSCQDFIKQWDYYYIDEYQDTNTVQKEIFDILLEETSFFKVGDPQQSIYLFRGAKSSIYQEEFKLAEKSHNISVDYLRTNYRSEKNLLMGINELFEHIDSKNFNPMHASKEDSGASKVNEKTSNRIFINHNLSDDLEKQQVIQLIENRIKSGVRLNEICILARTKSLLYQFETELQKAKIPSVLLISGNLENRMEIRQCLIFLSFLENPDNDLNFHAVLKSNAFKVTDDEIATLFRDYKAAKSWSLWVFTNSETCQNLDWMTDLRDYIGIYKERGIVAAFEHYLLQSNILNLAKSEMDLNRKHSNIHKLFAEIVSESSDSLTLVDSLKSILSKNIKSTNSEAVFSSSTSGVKLMTIHGSKGLEFDEVIVVGCHRKGNLTYTEAVEVEESGQFVTPFTDVNKNEKISGPLLVKTKTFRVDSERQETLRQIYVAATRARKNLHLYGQTRLGDNSIFKNLKLDQKSAFDWVDLMDYASEKNEENYGARNWDFKSYQNELLLFAKPFDAVFYNKIEKSEMGSKSNKLDNISVTRLVSQRMKETSYSKYRVLNEVAFEGFKIKNSLRGFEKKMIGDLFHKYLELYGKGVSEKDLMLKFNKTYFGELSGLSKVVGSLMKLDQPNFKELFRNCNVEWGFNSSITKGVLISGQIDLWGFDAEGILHVLDYKTGRSVYQNKAAIQLGIYKQVLEKKYPDVKIQTHILYLADGKLITVSGHSNAV